MLEACMWIKFYSLSGVCNVVDAADVDETEMAVESFLRKVLLKL